MTSPILSRSVVAPLFAGAMLGLAALGQASDASAQSLDETGMMRFLVQATCTDATGRPTAATPADAACVNRSAQTANSPATYRKHDWPGAEHRQTSPLGYQASDSVLSQPPRGEGDALVVAQSFDFASGGSGFGTFEPTYGDGGQVIAVTQGSAAIFMTEDGGGGRQWFVGDGCQTGQRPAEVAWLLFKDDVTTGGWNADVARLSTTRSQDECPANYGSAYTRYMRGQVSMPFMRAGAPDGSRTLDTVISEHYDLPTIEASTHLERFFLGRDLGLVRWERWESPATGSQETANQLDASGRCPAIAFSSPPAYGWRMIDCRMWTNIVPEQGSWSVRQLGWSGVDTQARSSHVGYGQYR